MSNFNIFLAWILIFLVLEKYNFFSIIFYIGYNTELRWWFNVIDLKERRNIGGGSLWSNPFKVIYNAIGMIISAHRRKIIMKIKWIDDKTWSRLSSYKFFRNMRISQAKHNCKLSYESQPSRCNKKWYRGYKKYMMSVYKFDVDSGQFIV